MRAYQKPSWLAVQDGSDAGGVSRHHAYPARSGTGTPCAHPPTSSRRPGPGSCGQAGLAVGQV